MPDVRSGDLHLKRTAVPAVRVVDVRRYSGSGRTVSSEQSADQVSTAASAMSGRRRSEQSEQMRRAVGEANVRIQAVQPRRGVAQLVSQLLDRTHAYRSPHEPDLSQPRAHREIISKPALRIFENKFHVSPRCPSGVRRSCGRATPMPIATAEVLHNV